MVTFIRYTGRLENYNFLCYNTQNLKVRTGVVGHLVSEKGTVKLEALHGANGSAKSPQRVVQQDRTRLLSRKRTALVKLSSSRGRDSPLQRKEWSGNRQPGWYRGAFLRP